MKTKYTYTDSSDFIKNLDFEYFETYSLLRGDKFESKIELMETEYDNLKAKKDLNELEKNRLTELDKLVNYNQLILNENGELHFSATKTNTFYKTDSTSNKLVEILKTEIKNVTDWMCSPFYRDAILFYDKNSKLITPLNICLSCSFIATNLFNNQINADDKVYELMSDFFINIGHDVEND